MKIISINLHGYQETNTLNNIKRLAKYIILNDIDIIFMQEVADILEVDKTNTAAILHSLLSNYYLHTEIFKTYDKVHGEGLAIISKYPFITSNSKQISKTSDFNSWQKRKILYGTINYNNKITFIATTHVGWITHKETSSYQAKQIKSLVKQYDNVILAGDFNCPKYFLGYKKYKKMGLVNIFQDNKLATYIGPAPFFVNESSKIIDHIFVKNFTNVKTERHFVTDPISDHVLMYAEIL